MRFAISLAIALGLAVGATGLPGTLYAVQGGNPVHNHIGHIMDMAPNPPEGLEGLGYLQMAQEESESAIAIMSLVTPATANRLQMRLAARQVMRCVEREAAPVVFMRGDPEGHCGRVWFGIRPAAAAIVRHVQLAAESPGASQAVQTHANHVIASANNIISRSDAIEDLVRQVFEEDDVDAERPMLVRIGEIVSQLLPGVDANGDGSIGWQEGEGGVDAIRQHMELMQTAAGL